MYWEIKLYNNTKGTEAAAIKANKDKCRIRSERILIITLPYFLIIFLWDIRFSKLLCT